jgi:hypothetical protein
MSFVSTDNYTLGMAELTFYEDTASTGAAVLLTWEIGNIVVASIAPEVTYLDHYTVTLGTRKKDRSLITNKALAINFTFDEITAGAMKEWLLASANATAASATGYEIYPMSKGEIKGCAKLEFNSEFGRDYTWYIPCASLKPDGSFDYNAEDWMAAKGIIECLVDDAGDVNKPFGRIYFDEDTEGIENLT